MSIKTQFVLGATGNLELTREPVANNSTELYPKENIVGVIPITVNKKPSNAKLFYDTYAGTFNIGDTITGVTSGATGTIVGFIGTTGLLLEDVTGQFVKGENLWTLSGFTKAGVSAGAGTWNGVPSTTSGAGVGATFDVTDVTGVYDSVAYATQGTGYMPGDTVTIAGTDLGGASPANDLVLTLTGGTAVATKDSEATSYDNEWVYPYDVMTIIEIEFVDKNRLNIELQDISNQPTWSTGDLAGQQAAIAAINAWL